MTIAPTKTAEKWRARARQEQLELIERQVAEGTLRIRQATPAERRRFEQEREAARERLK